MFLVRCFASLATVLLLTISPVRAEDGASSPIAETYLRQALPTADSFGQAEGKPSAVPAFKDGKLVGYIFSSRQVVNSKGYSAKPLDVVAGVDLDGIITGAVIAEHHEPILVIGVGDDDLDAFVAQYQGLDIRDTLGLETTGGESGLDAVSGATISSLVIHDAVLRSARAIARSRGILGGTGPSLNFAEFEPANWTDLVSEGSLRALAISVGATRDELTRSGGALFAEGVPKPPDDTLYLELFAGLATPARVGRNLIGDRRFAGLIAGLGPHDQLFFVAGRGLYSFKGRSYRKTGVFDRLEILQGEKTFRFGKEGHQGFEMLAIDGAPDLREIAFFTLAGDSGFDPSRPWRLQVLVPGVPTGNETPLARFELRYSLPDRYVVAAQTPEQPLELWLQTWRARAPEIAILSFALLVLTAILVFQDTIVKRRRLHEGVRLGFLVFTLIWLGWIAHAQLSIINVLTFLEAMMTEFRWEFFLLEPLIFILWSYVAVMLLFLGRGVFCGWLCPFGALQELLARLARYLRVPQWRLPFGLHERLWPIKYIVFVALFALFLHDPALAIKGAEIEPFKTAIILKFDRAWPFVLYALVLLFAGLFVTRAYCRYVCPLGGALALPARIRMFEWLKRRWQCGTPCQTCAQSCPVQAIHPEGKINPNECVHCLTCQVNYNDEDLCPPLAERKRRRDRANRARESKAAAAGQASDGTGAPIK